MNHYGFILWSLFLNYPYNTCSRWIWSYSLRATFYIHLRFASSFFTWSCTRLPLPGVNISSGGWSGIFLRSKMSDMSSLSLISDSNHGKVAIFKCFAYFHQWWGFSRNWCGNTKTVVRFFKAETILQKFVFHVLFKFSIRISYVQAVSAFVDCEIIFKWRR